MTGEQRREEVVGPGVEGLADGVERAVASRLSELEELHAAVSRYVSGARQSGSPPQDVIRILKDELNTHAASRLERREFAQLSEHVVHWTLDAYYGVIES